MPTAAVLFDFDFTLGDSSGAITECVQHACTACGHAAPEPASLRALIGLSLPVVHARLGLAPATTADFVATFHRHADLIMEGRTLLFEEALAAVESLRAAGFRTGIVSTKFRRRIVSVLAREQRSHLFDIVIGLEDVRAPKPDPDGILRALAALDTAPADALYTGDHEVDAQAAAAAGVPFLGVLTGATTRESFARHGAECIATLAALPGRLRCAV
jgi:phosphoglycolate phosphatase